MNHPTREEWMSYLYMELNGSERQRLSDHLRACPECEAAVGEWRATQRQLDTWKLSSRGSRPQPRSGFALPALRWAAAAALLLVLGFGVGRLTSPRPDAEQIRALVEPQVRERLQAAQAELRSQFASQLREELSQASSATLTASGAQTRAILEDYDRVLAARQGAEHDAIYSALGEIQSQHATDYLVLKRDLDTVAVNTDAGLRSTEQQLVQLAGYTQPGGSSVYPQK